MQAFAVLRRQRDVEQEPAGGETQFNAVAQFIQPLPRQRRNDQRLGLRAGLGRAAARGVFRRREVFGIEQIRLVPDFHQPAVAGINAEIGEDRLDVGALRLGVLMRDVADMQDDVGLDDLLERRPKSRDQHRRQLGDEADGVGEDDLAAMRQRDRAQRRVERREQHVGGEHLGARQAIEEGRFSGIGVADQRDDRKRHGAAALAVQAAGALDAVELALDLRHALLDQAAVGLDLGLAGSAKKAEAAALALKMGPGADKPGFLIGEMGEFDLKRAFARSRPASENLQNKTRSGR